MATDWTTHLLPAANRTPLFTPREREMTAAARQLKRLAPLGVILLLHVGFFYALQSGLLRQAAAVLPREVVASFISPEPAHQPPKPQAAPRTVPVVKKPVTRPRPAVPVVNTTPSPQAIAAPATPPAAPAPAEPAAPAITAPPSPAAPAMPRTITTGIEYLQAPQPEYPPIARRMGEQGKTILRVLVNEKGRPESVEVQKSSGSARLDEAARQAVLRALFKPFLDDGKAVAAYAIIPIRFQLDN
ncbi:energy transducer TonB [Noviherbaspirillum sp.]|uniref:energy transducer TonB n=1 Tax=Noviherbaspirillum sp. TaxID=1926288 RepID=UPI0025D9432F|nr:energy transducer TonB [Noviherbaspirillum sp.]